MEELKQNPQDIKVFGNIISDEYGYLESLKNMMVHQCEVSENKVEIDGWNDNNVYSFRLTKNENLYNHFTEDIKYMRSAEDMFVCDHLESDLDSLSELFDIEQFMGGLRLTVKSEYSGTTPFYLLIHQEDAGVEIPSNVNNILYSANYAASPTIQSIKAGFVFFNQNGLLLENQEIAELVNEGTGSEGRCNVNTSDIPEGSKYVSIEFQFPEGAYAGDYFELSLNSLLFNDDYGGFVI